MSRKLVLALAGAGLALTFGTAQAQVDAAKAQAVAKEAGCMACHDVNKKKMGPAFKDVAKKFPKQGDKVLAALKADKDHADAIKGVSDANLKLLTDWVASL